MALDLETVNDSLDRVSTRQILEWAMRTWPDEVAMSSSFQTQSVPLLHMVAQYAPGLPVLFIDTGQHFPETLAFRDRLVNEWGLKLVVVEGHACGLSAADSRQAPLYLTDPDRCCEQHKVAPMRLATRRYRSWISGIRHDQAASRADARVVELLDQARYRIHPMLAWSERQVQQYIHKHHLPEHPLSKLGYLSIGCAPCTSLPLAGGNARSGRWAGRVKTECGLHTTLRKSIA